MSSPDPEALERYAREFNASSNLQFFGVEIGFPQRAEGRIVEATLKVKPEHRGGLGAGAVNGGMLAALFDLVIGVTPALLEPTRRVATIQLSMNFERAVLGDRVTVEGRVENATRDLVFASARLLDGSGAVCAHCQGVVKMSTSTWKNGSSPAIG